MLTDRLGRPSLEEVAAAGLRVITDPAARGAGVLVAFTDRAGGVSAPPYDDLNLAARVGDDAMAVAENRRRAARAVGFDAGRLALARQVHGAGVIHASPGDGGVIGEADILVTRSPGVVVGILTADCTPVVVAGARGVSIVHAGWRGLIAGAVQRAVDEIEPPACAWVGPSIRACCYEVGPEVIEGFRRAGLPVAGASRVDPGAAAAAALRHAGVDRVAAATDCTSCDRRYFSYRRDGVTGRQGAFAAIVEGPG